MSKKNVLFFSLLYIILSGVLIALYSFFPDACYTNSWCEGNAETILRVIAVIFLPMVLVLLSTLITYRMHNDVFIAWRKFAIWAVPIMTFLNIVMALQPTSGGLGIESAYNGGLKLLAMAVLGLCFAVISLVIISWRFFASRHSRPV